MLTWMLMKVDTLSVITVQHKILIDRTIKRLNFHSYEEFLVGFPCVFDSITIHCMHIKKDALAIVKMVIILIPSKVLFKYLS